MRHKEILTLNKQNLFFCKTNWYFYIYFCFFKEDSHLNNKVVEHYIGLYFQDNMYKLSK